MKKILALALAALMVLTLAACVGDNGDGNEGVKEIYFLNFKPENGDKYKAIAEEYEAQTGVKVKVETAAEGGYETTLTAEITKTDPPTIFQINGPVGYSNWSDYCADLKDTELYDLLSDKSLAVTSGGGVFGIPYTVEGYGIIVNTAIFDAYFASENKTSDVASLDEMNNFAKMEEVVKDMTAMKDELGLDGVFASTSLSPGDDWRWQTHLANMPLYYEFKAQGDTITAALNAADISFSNNENFKNIFDLYTEYSTTPKNLLGSKKVDDSMAEFALGKAAMVQNGFWATGQILDVDGAVVTANDLQFIPIYTGVAGEESQGLCVGTENYFCVNSQVDEDIQQASIDFLVWLFSSDYGVEAAVADLNLMPPFTSFADAKYDNPLVKSMTGWVAKDGITSVPWTFVGMPSQTWKDNLGANLLLYVQDQTTWDELVAETIADWATERAKAAE
ncbi:MAG: ABC transporter substrate-binding protein [Oscillospiraceae bacterium]|nr:ABC transporter substrate-binding protein [Oscillospiraceae bacterium]